MLHYACHIVCYKEEYCTFCERGICLHSAVYSGWLSVSAFSVLY